MVTSLTQQDELVKLRLSAQAAAHAFKFQKAAFEAQAAQVRPWSTLDLTLTLTSMSVP